MARRDKIISAFLGVGAACLAGYAGCLYMNPESEGVNRQNKEESLAQAYIQSLLSEKENETATLTMPTESEMKIFSEEASSATALSTSDLEKETEKTTEKAEKTEIEETTKWADPNYYVRDGVTYTPDYAMGELLGVLEVDRAGIRRGVYGGSWEAIAHDLDIWMATEARPDYEIGKTHFAIYGHNHTVQDLSFNRLKDVVPGDVFTYTTDKGVFIYDVTRFFADWRELVTRDYVDNFSIPADKCYIISCGRNEYRYKDIVVEGTLRCIVDLTDYAEKPDYYKYEYDPEADVTTDSQLLSTKEAVESSLEESETFVEEETSTEDTTISLKEAYKKTYIEVSCTTEGNLSAVCLDSDGKTVPCEMALFDSDGLIVTSWIQPEEEMPHADLVDGADYVVGVLSLSDTDFITPEEYVFRYHSGLVERQDLYQEDNLDENGAPGWARPLFFGMAGVLMFLLALLLFSKK